MRTMVGEISEIYRYPVKSFTGERLNSCRVESYGLYGDRFCALYDPSKEGWESFVTARAIPEMLSYRATLSEQGITVTSADGRTFGWDEHLLAEMNRYAKKRKIAMSDFRAPNPEIPGLMAVDLASILIITDSSLRKLEVLSGRRIDPRRFRPNLIIAVEHTDLNENDWLGKRIFAGDTELLVDTRCERCSMITIDPNTLRRDPALLRTVNDELDLCFGVYASVRKPGLLQAGQQVYLLE